MSEAKYKLIKDLPFCSSGKVVRYVSDEIEFDYDDNRFSYVFKKHMFPHLIEKGWIEEIKPKTQEELAIEIIQLVQFGKDFDCVNPEDLNQCINEVISKYKIEEL